MFEEEYAGNDIVVPGDLITVVTIPHVAEFIVPELDQEFHSLEFRERMLQPSHPKCDNVAMSLLHLKQLH